MVINHLQVILQAGHCERVLNVTFRGVRSLMGKIIEKKPGKGTPQEIVGAGKGLKLRDNDGSLILEKRNNDP